MEILIANGYVRENKGDAALIAVMCKQLTAAFPHARISISGMEDAQLYPDFYGFRNVGSLRLYAIGVGVGRTRRIFRKLFVGVVGIIWPVLPWRTAIARFLPEGMRGELLALEYADIVVSASGGYLGGPNSFATDLHIYLSVLPLRLAERLGKMVVMAPESFGPFGNAWQRRIVRETLNDAKLVFVREDKSYALLREIGIREDNMVRAIDSGFLHEGHSTQTTGTNDTRMRVGVTARQWLGPKEQEQYEKALADFIVMLEKKYGATVTLIPQVTSTSNGDDDRIVEGRIKQLAMQSGAHPIQITDEIDHDDIKSLYSGFTYTIGTRFHSVIFSLTSYVPAIAIEYEHKTSGIMHDLGLDEWVVKIENVTAKKLDILFEKLISDQETYRQHLKTVLPDYIRRADEVPNLIKQVYDAREDDLRK